MDVERGKIQVTRSLVIKGWGVKPQGFEVCVYENGLTVKGQCARDGCANLEKFVDHTYEGNVEVLNCTGPRDDCLGDCRMLTRREREV